MGSVGLELNDADTPEIISYEEYHPYGTTAYTARGADVRAVAKRYRYTGMERDEETGLNYHTARYYMPWLGRWCSADPVGIVDGLNVYQYGGHNPIIAVDRSGSQARSLAELMLDAIGAMSPADADAQFEATINSIALEGDLAHVVRSLAIESPEAAIQQRFNRFLRSGSDPEPDRPFTVERFVEAVVAEHRREREAPETVLSRQLEGIDLPDAVEEEEALLRLVDPNGAEDPNVLGALGTRLGQLAGPAFSDDTLAHVGELITDASPEAFALLNPFWAMGVLAALNANGIVSLPELSDLLLTQVAPGLGSLTLGSLSLGGGFSLGIGVDSIRMESEEASAGGGGSVRLRIDTDPGHEHSTRVTIGASLSLGPRSEDDGRLGGRGVLQVQVENFDFIPAP